MMKMLSHLRSLCMIRCSCRYASPSRICRHHFFTTLRFTRFIFSMYLGEHRTAAVRRGAAGRLGSERLSVARRTA